MLEHAVQFTQVQMPHSTAAADLHRFLMHFDGLVRER